ncbi:glycosyltransferase family 4 protein [Agrococcus sediminis]|uniref:glycosyltransferase family 4 protein n=1 Tax=Agrococcus sediminis TaxID=2599924 RepID=UPI00341D0DD5
MTRLRILVGAYACGPSDEPEASAGWAFATAAAATHDVWVITRRRFAPAIAEALAADRELARHLHVVAIDLPERVMARKRRPRDLYWYYALWQAKLARTAVRLHARHRFDVAHHVTFANDWLPCGLTALRDVPLVWGPVGGATRIPVWRLRRWLGARGVATEVVRTVATTLPRAVFGDGTARRAALVVAQNGDVARRFRRARRVVVEPNAALDLTALPARARREPEGRMREAVAVGRLIPLKGVSIALAALARPAASHWRLTLYGEGPLRRALEAEAERLGLGDRVRFAGHVPRREALEAMARADALLFPSMHDQAGWAVAEASSMGTPVVCLPLGGPPLLAQPNGFVASLEGDVVASVVEQLALAGDATGVPHERWSRERLAPLVDGWYRGAASPARHRPVRVLESVKAIRPTTNPYLAQLLAELDGRPDAAVETFSYPRALLGRYDVFHVHWPEVLFGGHRTAGRLVRRSLTTLLLARLTLTRTPIVRTWHNTERPQELSRWDHALLDAVDQRTTGVIRLNETTAVPLRVPVHTIPHAHFRDWFGEHETLPATPGRLVSVGLIRRYKGTEQLLRAFRECRTPGATLAIAGRPTSDDLARTLEELAAGDDRIELSLRFLDDADFVRAITGASLVVLPYLHMHNSSAALAGLSLDRPVLVPDNAVNRALADEVGPGWVHRFEGTLTGAAIDAALAELAAHPPEEPPRLAARTWSWSAEAHVEAFRTAAGLR